MLSIVTSSNRPAQWRLHEDHVRDTCGCAHEYVRVENRDAAKSLCAAYNEGVDRSRGDVLVFVHEDVFFVTSAWGAIIEAKMSADMRLGMIGVAGTQYLFDSNPFWVAAGQPYLRGRVVHELRDKGRHIVTIFSRQTGDTEVVAVDGLFFAIRRSLFDHIRFDDQTFDGFHFYDIDICMQVRKSHRAIVTSDILVKHCSAGAFDQNWTKYAARFVQKYRQGLPASCVSTIPERRKKAEFESIELEMVVSPSTAERIKALGREEA